VNNVSTSKIDSKGRTLIPKEIRDKLRWMSGARLTWITLGEELVGVRAKAEETDASDSVINFLETISPAEIKRFDKPDYRPISKADLWLSAVRE